MKPSSQPEKKSSVEKLRQVAALDDFVRLQQVQEEYLMWLEESEKKVDMDSYVYKKVR